MLKNENISFDPSDNTNFEEKCLKLFVFQYKNNAVYRHWVDLLKVNPEEVNSPENIPFLPIEFFKKFEVVSSPMSSATIKFISSGTSGQSFSTHYVNDVSVYESSFLTGFNRSYGEPSGYCILALLPNYLQRGGSSLVYMCHRLIEQSKQPLSGFFLNNIVELKSRIEILKTNKQKTILIGVSYALMDLCDSGIELNSDFIVMETGGMKGTRKELLKEELAENVLFRVPNNKNTSEIDGVFDALESDSHLILVTSEKMKENLFSKLKKKSNVIENDVAIADDNFTI